MAACVQTMVRSAGCSLRQAIGMATLNAARVVGVEDRKGSLEPGKDADLVVLDEAGQVQMTIVRGQTVYRRGQPH
jgi:N-acetylglucosamine-6-phosphate deacetylase